MKKTYKPGWRSHRAKGNRGLLSQFMISNLRLLLPLGVLTVLALIFLWPKFIELMQEGQKPKTMERILKVNPQLENKVINPQLESRDEKGRPYLVQAEYAVNLNEAKSDFVNPSGHIHLEDGSLLSFQASTGTYFKEQELLELEHNVFIKTDKGYDLATEYMKLYVKENKGEGHLPVHGTGPSDETIDAEGFRLTDKGDIIDFLGKTKITLPGAG